MTEQNHDAISRRAYERYESRGRTDGHDQADWFEAEQEFRGNATDDAADAAGGPQDVNDGTAIANSVATEDTPADPGGRVTPDDERRPASSAGQRRRSPAPE